MLQLSVLQDTKYGLSDVKNTLLRLWQQSYSLYRIAVVGMYLHAAVLDILSTHNLLHNDGTISLLQRAWLITCTERGNRARTVKAAGFSEQDCDNLNRTVLLSKRIENFRSNKYSVSSVHCHLAEDTCNCTIGHYKETETEYWVCTRGARKQRISLACNNVLILLIIQPFFSVYFLYK
jgi:hypothetical protein